MLMLARRVFIDLVWPTWTMSISTSLCQNHYFNYSRWLRQHSKEGEGVADVQPAARRGDTEMKVMQQKSEDRDATSDLLLKHPDATVATYV
jgi:hypothetical protein